MMTSAATASARKKPKGSPRPGAKKTKAAIAFLAERAAAYFESDGRDFPWRRESNPYRLAVAEILLQKTRAQSIVGTYLEMVETLPDANALASAGHAALERRLLPLGLSGKRARQFVELAEALGNDAASMLRDWRTAMKTVPGIGSYAARAIACFSFGETVGIVDANVARILRRVFAIRTADPRAAVFQRYADAIAAASKDARATNFGLLDLGAAVCVRRPRCGDCPLAAVCRYAKRQARSGVRTAAQEAPPLSA
jgi:A/G-specific adenine glycosylase